MKKMYLLLILITTIMIVLGIYIYKKYISITLKAFEEKILTELDSVRKITQTSEPAIYTDCKFDLNSQTDDFLKNKKEFSNYNWNAEKKTAQVQLNTNTQLSIERGGCNQFNFYITLTLDHSNLTEQNKKEIFNEILPIAEKIFENEDYNILYIAIMTGNYELFQYKNEFLMEIHNEKYCSANLYFQKKGNGKTILKLGFTKC